MAAQGYARLGSRAYRRSNPLRPAHRREARCSDSRLLGLYHRLGDAGRADTIPRGYLSAGRFWSGRDQRRAIGVSGPGDPAQRATLRRSYREENPRDSERGRPTIAKISLATATFARVRAKRPLGSDPNGLCVGRSLSRYGAPERFREHLSAATR